jgi:hypothetical protein
MAAAMRAVCFVMLISACTPSLGSPYDASVRLDAAAPRDASPPHDAGEPTADAQVWSDGGSIGVACSVDGVAGRCELVSRCRGVATPGRCPGPAEVQCCTSSSACDPTARPTPNEGLTEAPGDPGCLAGMVRVGASLCIDRYEASLVFADGASASPYHDPGAARVRAVSIGGAVPQGYISGRRAAAACEEAGKRLCTDAEWLRACQGTSASIYPYGDTRQEGVCNDARAVHPAIERFGTSADWIWSRLDDACINQLPDSLALTGEHEGCVSAEGALDMMGNLHEWTADPAGTFRGGFYADTRLNGDGCLYRTTAHDIDHLDYSTGFRCCAAAL